MKNHIVVSGLLIMLLPLLNACNGKQVEAAQKCDFSKEFIDQHNGYSEAVVIRTCDSQTLYISGQVGEGPDLDAQMRSAIAKLKELLNKMGADTEDIVKMNTYIVGYDEAQLEVFRKVRKELLGDEKMPASTLVGVEALGKKEWLIEMEAIAVIPM